MTITKKLGRQRGREWPRIPLPVLGPTDFNHTDSNYENKHPNPHPQGNEFVSIQKSYEGLFLYN